MSKELARRLGNKMMVEKHNQWVKEYWEDQGKLADIRAAEEAHRHQQERQNALNLFDRVTNPGLDPEAALRNLAISQTRQAEEAARAQGRQYTGSQQAQQNRQMAQQMADQMAANTGMDVGFFLAQNQDPKEKEYDAAANYYRNQRENLEAQRTTEANLAEMGKWTKEERDALMYYAINRFNTEMAPEGVPVGAQAYQNLIPVMDKYGQKRVMEIAESFTRNQNAIHAEDLRERGAQWADSGFWGALGNSAATVAANAIGTVSAPLGYLQEMATRTGQYRTLDPNNMGNLPSVYSGAVRNTVAENIRGEGGALRAVGAVTYQGLMSAADNVARIYMAGGSGLAAGGLAAMGSFGSTVSEASANGADPTQAVLLGVASAGLEMVTEKFSIDRFLRSANSAAGVRALLKEAAKSGAIEVSEEELSFLGNLAAEALILRERSSYNQQIGELVANGMSYQQAKEQADRAIWNEAVNTAATSFISGGFMEAGKQLGAAQQERAGFRQELAGDIRATMERESNPEANASTAEATESNTEAEYLDRAAEVIGREKQEPEKPRGYTDQQLREAMAEMYPREHTELAMPESTGIKQQMSARDAATANGLRQLVKDIESGMSSDELSARSREYSQEYTQIQKEIPYGQAYTEEQRDRMHVADVLYSAYRSAARDPQGTANMYRAFLDDVEAGVDAENVRYDRNGRTELPPTPTTVEDSGENEVQRKDVISSLSKFKRGRRIKAANGYSVAVHTRNGSDTVTLSIGTPDGEYFPEEIENGRFWTNEQLKSLAVDRIMEHMGKDRYAPEGAPEGFEAMGAASRGYTGQEAYYDLLTDENVQPVRPWAVREMEVPKADKDGRRVTEFAANAAGAAATSDAVADTLAQLIGEGAMSFDSRSKQQSINNAVSELEKRPISEVVREISERVSQGTIKDGDIEKALVAYNLLSNDGTADGQARAAAMLPMLGKMANISGRNLNMFGILKKLDPNMQVQAVQDDIDRTIKELNKERSGGSVIEGEQMRINEDLAEVFKEAKTEEEKAKALDDIYKDIASRIKPTVWEMWDAWRNLAMLGNFKTHLRNIFGSAAFRPSVNAKRVVGAALERVFVDQENRTKAIIGTSAQDKALLAWAKQDAKNENIQKMMQYSGTTGNEVRSAIEEQRRYLPGKLEEVRRFNMDRMEKADMVWKKREYALALAGFLKARGYTAKQAAMDIMAPGGVPTEVMDEARSYAAKEAMKATFNDRNRFSDAVARLRVKGNKPWDRAANMVLKGSLPYTRTPANVLVRAVEYSPAGIAKSLYEAVDSIRGGESTMAEAMDSLAAGLTGTGAMMLGAALAYGLIPGVKLIGRLDEEERERDPNAIEYSVKIGDKYYGISWLAPGAIPLLIGANLYQSIQDKEEIADGWDVLSALGGTVADTLDPLLELSMLSSLNDLVETVRYEDSPGEMALAAVTNATTNYFTQGLPTLFGQIEQATEKTKSSVYSNADNPMQRGFERTVGRATQRLPGIDLYQTERLDAEGNPVENGPWYQRAFDAIINPFTHSESGTTPVTKEISRLGVTAPTVSKTVTYADDQGNKREDYRLSAEEFSNMQRIQLGNTNRIMSEMLESSDYEKLPDELKEKALEYVKDYARELARGEVLPGYDGKSAWMEGIEGKEAAAIIGKVAGAELSDAFTALTTGWREGYADDSGALEALASAAKVYEAMSPEMQETVLEGVSGRVGAYLDARAAGMDDDTFTGLYRKYWEIDQSGAGATEQAQKWAYELERAAERREITPQQKTVLKDSLRFFQNFPAETEKFDQLTESGLSADQADDLGWLLKGLEVQDGYKDVRDIQKAEAIGNSTGLSEADKIAALKIYGSDAQDENLDQMLDLGYSARDYINAWKLITAEKEKGGNGTKNRTVKALAQMYGISTANATEIYEIWYPKSK